MSDLLEEIYFSLSANKSRSALTILGIVIGISSVIAMISIGQGATKNITSQIESLGTNLLVVMPGSQRQAGNLVRGGMGSSQSLTLADAEAIKTIADTAGVAPTVSSRKQTTAKGANTNTSIYGIDENYFSLRNVELAGGIGITVQQNKSRSKVAVLGPTVITDLFGEGANPLGQKIRVSNQEFLVVGATKSKGGSGLGSSDDLIYIPLYTAQQYLQGNDSVSNINVQVTTEDKMSVVQQKIQALLLQRHRIADVANADFSVMNQADMLATMSSVTDTLTMLLAAIAGISLLVGGIGIMNMMLTTVTERTREIGLRKSLGAKKRDIEIQFLVEAMALTLIGGVIGVFLGWLTALLISKLSTLTTSVTATSVILSCGISAAVGIVFGFYPARRAAQLDPIDALRYQ